MYSLCPEDFPLFGGAISIPSHETGLTVSYERTFLLLLLAGLVYLGRRDSPLTYLSRLLPIRGSKTHRE